MTSKASHRSLFDYVAEAEKVAESNKFCSVHDLSNEASVENFLLARMIPDLGYQDSEVLPKKSLKAVIVSPGGRKKENYRPDYVFVCEDSRAG